MWCRLTAMAAAILGLLAGLLDVARWNIRAHLDF